MKIITIIFLFIFVSFIKCTGLKLTDFCKSKQGKLISCHGSFNFNCGDFVCTRAQYNCHVLSMFSGLNGLHRKNYVNFIYKIRNCPELPKYKWKKTDVCFNSKTCGIRRLWPMKITQLIECKCTGEHNFKCSNKDYCGIDERACEGLKNTSTIGKIEKC